MKYILKQYFQELNSKKQAKSVACQGGVIFEEKNWAHVMLQSTVMGPQIQILLRSVAFSLGAGLHKASENPLNPQKRPKISTHKFYLTFLKNSSETKFAPYFILKLKMKRNQKKYFFYYFVGQKPFLPKKNINFQGPCDFLKM